MKKIFKYSIYFVAMVCSICSLSFLTSCEEAEKSSEVVLLSFGPSGVNHGDEITFFGQNLDKVTAIVLKPNVEIPKGSFLSVSSERINIIVPETAEAGTILLKTPQGEIESQTILNFDVPVVIESITAEAKPGTNITITGEKVNWIEDITFPSDLVISKDDFVSRSLTEIVVTVPMEAQTGFLIFTLGGTSGMTFGTEEQLVVTLPTVTSLAPASLKHTDDLTITGTDLDLVTSVVFGGDISTSTFVSQSETEIVVAVPVGAQAGTLTLKQASPIDVVTTDEVSIILPAGNSISPSPAVPGVDNIVITGTNLNLVDKIVLPGAGAVSTFVNKSDTQIELALPATATQGAVGYITIHGYEDVFAGIILKLPATGSYPTLDYYIYKDGLQNGWQAYGGWGHVSQSYTNDENPADGEVAIKTVFNDAYGAIQINNPGSPTVFSGYNYLVFYVYVQGENSDIIVQIGSNGDYYPASFTGDKYHQIVVPLADLAGSNNVNELRIKNNNADAATNNTIVFVDEIGLTVDVPDAPYAAPDTYIYSDAMAAGWDTWDGWGHSSKDWTSAENSFKGSAAIKVVYNDGYGALQIHPQSSTALVGYAELVLYVWFDADGQYAVQFNNAGEKTFNVTGGQFNRLVVPLSEFATEVANLNELRFKNYGTTANHTVFIDEVGLNF